MAKLTSLTKKKLIQNCKRNNERDREYFCLEMINKILKNK